MFHQALFGQPDVLAKHGGARCLFGGAERFQAPGRAPSDEAGAVAATAEGQGQRPEPRSGHPRQPDLVNGSQAEIPETDARRVRFRDEDGRTFSFPHEHRQLRHLDHAWCSTVYGAQGRTAHGVTAVLDARGAADQAMFHVEVSRAAEAFLLLTDDHEALVEVLEARPGRQEGALEALGLDPAEPPAAEPELSEALAADWRAAAAGRRGGCAPVPSAGLRGGHDAGGSALHHRGPAGGHTGIRGWHAGRA